MDVTSVFFMWMETGYLEVLWQALHDQVVNSIDETFVYIFWLHDLFFSWMYLINNLMVWNKCNWQIYLWVPHRIAIYQNEGEEKEI